MDTTATHEMTSDGIVIVGGGLAAARTGEQLRKSGYAGPITIVGTEVHLPYDRPPLSKQLLRGEVDGADGVTLKPREFYDQHRITLRLGAAVTGVDTAARILALADGTSLGYDELVIATGVMPRSLPAFPARPGIQVLRTIEHSLELRRQAVSAQHAVVVGAGFIGCEVAAGLRHLGCHVVLVESQSAPLASVLGEQIGALVARLHRDEGVDVRTGTGVTQVHGQGAVEDVTLTDGTRVPADLVVVGIGSRPATDWLAGSGIDVDNGVLCDGVGRTTTPHVWALGDVASWRTATGHQARVEHWSNVAEQARILVPALLGRQPAAKVVVPYFWSDQYDVKIQCLGEPRPGDAVHLIEDDGRNFLAYYERDGVLAAVVGAGMATAVMPMRAKIAAGTPLTELRGQPAASGV